MYTFISFLLVCPQAPNAMGLEPKYYLYIALKSFVIFIAWILSFVAIKRLPISMYGVLDLSRVLFATILGVAVLGEYMSAVHVVGLVLVCLGLLLLKFSPKQGGLLAKQEQKYSTGLIIVALISCMLNSVSGFMDKILMKDINSSQLQFWYMLFLTAFYIIYALIMRKHVSVKRAVTNKWIWILAIMFVIADKALFVANGMADSRITVMTLLKQAGAIVTILAGKFIFKEKNVTHKLICAGIIIAGIILGVL